MGGKHKKEKKDACSQTAKKQQAHKEHAEDKLVMAEKSELDELKKKAELADERLDQLMRARAEFENIKKRMNREKEEFLKFANDELLSELLPILDNFRRALDNSDESHNLKDVLKGIELIDRQLEDKLKEFGLEPVEAEGKKFDPHFHEAVAHEETDKYPENTVTEVLQRGYTLNGRLLRPAVVKVAKAKSL